MGGVKRVQEFQKQGYSKPWDPFRTGIWYLSNLIREDFLWEYYRLEFTDALIADMVQKDPQKRPAIDEVVARFDEIQKSTPWWKLRARLAPKKEDILTKIFREFGHFFRTVVCMILRWPSVPTPAS
ncbi:hypothetical protein AcW1_007988 [Taiwanofungus camphoratus]|nr:hypothetical protein AcW1_007988 [Antrodia cinnamomea]